MNVIAQEMRMSEAVSRIRDDLLHVRRIHFLLLLISVTLSYLVFSGWSSAPGLISDLYNLRKLIADFKTDKIGTSDFVRIQWRWANQEADKLLRRLQVATKTDQLRWALASSEDAAEILKLRERGLELLARRSESKDSARRAFRIIEIIKPDIFNEEDAHLGEIGSAFESVGVRIEAIKSFANDPEAIALGQWAGQHLSDGASRIEIDDFQIKSWPSTDRQGEAEVSVTAVYEQTRPGQGGFLEVKRKAFSMKGMFSFESEKREIRIDMESFWENFPILKGSFLKETRLLTLDEAIAWAQRKRTESLQGSETSISGLKVEGAYVGVVGPPAIILFLMYILCYLTHISKGVAALDGGERLALAISSPWLGAMVNVWARVLGPLTLLLAPFFGVVLPLWRFTELNLLLSTLIGLLALAAGGFCLMLGARIARGE